MGFLIFIQIPQGCFTGIGAIDPDRKSHNASVPYPTMHDFVTHVCTFLLQNGALWDICLMDYGICEMGLLYDCHSANEVTLKVLGGKINHR